MPKVFLYAEIKATWTGGLIKARPGESKELARIGVRLLVEELGTQGARRFLRRELARYRPDYAGDGKVDPDGPLKP